jgi:hypothetical protein
MTLRWLPCSFASVLVLAACGGDDGGGTGESGTTGDEPTTSTTLTTTMTTTDPDTGSTSVDETTTSGPDTTGETTVGDTTETGTTGDVDCGALPRGPFEAVEVLTDLPFDGSEDLAFDGQGGLAARADGDLIRATADGQFESIAMLGNVPTYGVRYLADGSLVAAAYMNGQILHVLGDGSVEPFIDTQVGGVNGLYPDLEGNVWFTNFSAVVRIDAGGTPEPIVTGPDGSAANGVVYDAEREVLFYTNYNIGGTGYVQRVAFGMDGTPLPPEEVAQIEGAALDGMVLDACGNLYVVDQGNTRLFRLWLDADGAATEDPENLVSDGLTANIANAQFGSGEGWEPTSLYAIGVPGALFQVDIGVPGAPVVVVQ